MYQSRAPREAEKINMTIVSQASWLPVKEKHGGGAEGSGPKVSGGKGEHNRRDA